LRWTEANIKIIGAAVGNIMATIISAHMRNSGGRVPTDHALVSGPDIFIPAQQHEPVAYIARASYAMYHHARTVVAARATRMIWRSRLRIDSMVQQKLTERTKAMFK
jgi:hypothetical protein